MRISWLLAGLAVAASSMAVAQDAMSISRSLFLERAEADGVSLEPADVLRRGDRVILVMDWDGRTGQPFMLTSRVPDTLAYQRSGDRGVEVSVDGGRNWGRIGSLRRGARLAAPEEVTNLRWRIAAADGATMRSYSAIVR